MGSADDLLAESRKLRGQLEYAQALALARAAVTARQTASARGPELAECQLMRGRLEEDLGDPDAAEAAYLGAAAAALPATPACQSVRIRALTRLAAVLRYRGAMAEADAALAQSLATAETQLPGGLEHAELLAERSRQLVAHGAHEEAEQFARRAVAMAEAAPSGMAEAGAAQGEARTRALTALGTVLRVSGRYPEAHAVLRDAVTTAQATFGPGSLEAADALNDLGVCDKFAGLFDEGIEQYQRALAIFTDTVGLDNPNVATIYHNLGGILHAKHDYDAAEPWGRRAVELRVRLFGPGHVLVAADRAALAAILMGLGRYDEAEGLLTDALACLEQAFGPENHEVVANYGNLALIARRRGDLAEAERLYRRALEIRERMLGPGHPEVATTLNNLAVVCRRRGRLDEAEALLRRAIDVLSRTVEPAHPTLAAARGNLSRLLGERVPGAPQAPRPDAAPSPGGAAGGGA